MRQLGSVLYPETPAEQEHIIKFVRQRIPGMAPLSDAVALGIVQRGRLVGGFVYTNFIGHNIQVSAAVDCARWATRGTLDQMFGYPFRQLGCARITAVTREDNKRTQRILTGTGFKQEGRARKGWDGHHDAIIFGILKEECRFLKGFDNGLTKRSCSSAAS